MTTVNQVYNLIYAFIRKYIDENNFEKHIINLIFLMYFGKQDIKILFLDVDGVLNKLGSFIELNKTLILRLKKIIHETQCKIVLSSDWRLSQNHKKQLFNGSIETIWKY